LIYVKAIGNFNTLRLIDLYVLEIPGEDRWVVWALADAF